MFRFELRRKLWQKKDLFRGNSIFDFFDEVENLGAGNSQVELTITLSDSGWIKFYDSNIHLEQRDLSTGVHISFKVVEHIERMDSNASWES